MKRIRVEAFFQWVVSKIGHGKMEDRKNVKLIAIMTLCVAGKKCATNHLLVALMVGHGDRIHVDLVMPSLPIVLDRIHVDRIVITIQCVVDRKRVRIVIQVIV